MELIELAKIIKIGDNKVEIKKGILFVYINGRRYIRKAAITAAALLALNKEETKQFIEWCKYLKYWHFLLNIL